MLHVKALGHVVVEYFFFNFVSSFCILFLIFRDATGKFPEYPDEDDGGSALIFKEKSPEELEAEMKEKVFILEYVSCCSPSDKCKKFRIFFY